MTDDNSLFDSAAVLRPLAERLRPSRLEEIAGFETLAENSFLKDFLKGRSDLPSLILWGPPGCGKTSLALLLAEGKKARFIHRSAVLTSTVELKKIFEAAKEDKKRGQETVVFVDEIHRFNKAQQDSFLSYVERGDITLLGATTENPSFSLNRALLSRCHVLVMGALSEKSLQKLIERAEAHLGRPFPLDTKTRDYLMRIADGDGRALLNALDLLRPYPALPKLGFEELNGILGYRVKKGDPRSDIHYNLISALHKSIRGSDPQAALFYTAEMLERGEDPRFILRRLLVAAAEDIGMADPQALLLAHSVADLYDRVGSPEGEIAIGTLVCYLATAPKSNAGYTALKKARHFSRQIGAYTVPPSILNAPSQLMKDLRYGEGYLYDHDFPYAFSGQRFLPQEFPADTTVFYTPTDRGYEKDVQKRLHWWAERRRKIRNAESPSEADPSEET